jgi:hypothetical protein
LGTLSARERPNYAARAEQLQAVTDDRALEAVDQPPSVREIAHDLLQRIAPSHHVVGSALKVDPQSPRHVGTLHVRDNVGHAEKQQTKSVSA